ncbi:MAG: alanine:cation symporter family protein, partial [Pontibacter sp.]|nr:alanine:cation symporter family protein [Pontibacter sp.]
MPLLILLMGGGFYFMLYSGFLPFRFLGHAINVLRGKYDDPDDPGDISHFEALSSALAATVGMGNISGVAVAIAGGGPGVLFWMWVSAFVGMATKFFTCSLAVMYRGRDSNGHIEGGPMYVVVEGLGRKWKPLAVFFSVAGLFGTLPIFQANQLTQVLREVVLMPNGIATENPFYWNLGIGLTLVAITSLVIFGGIKRIGYVAGKMVPGMVLLYMLAVFYIMFTNYQAIPDAFAMIIEDAFSARAVLSGAVGAIIIAGARRAAFSNEAGIGTAAMMHGAAKTDEPIREGLVAMLGPFIDTLVVCTLTGLAIIITGTWQTSDGNGVTMTATAF